MTNKRQELSNTLNFLSLSSWVLCYQPHKTNLLSSNFDAKRSYQSTYQDRKSDAYYFVSWLIFSSLFYECFFPYRVFLSLLRITEIISTLVNKIYPFAFLKPLYYFPFLLYSPSTRVILTKKFWCKSTRILSRNVEQSLAPSEPWNLPKLHWDMDGHFTSYIVLQDVARKLLEKSTC